MGYDVHKLVEGRKLILGGVEIPYEKGLLGHSDADVLVHAIMDALLGAAALGDIGKHFPDTDPAYKGADSLKLLEHVGNGVLFGTDYHAGVSGCYAGVVASPRVMPGEQGVARRGAGGCHRMGIGEHQSLRCQAFHVGRVYGFLAVAAEVAVSDVVGNQEYHVWQRVVFLLRCRVGGERCCAQA